VTAVVVKDWGAKPAARACLVEHLEMTQPEADDALRASLPWTTELPDEIAAGFTRCLRTRARATVSDAPVVVSI
jgi:hypothetical protein